MTVPEWWAASDVWSEANTMSNRDSLSTEDLAELQRIMDEEQKPKHGA